MNATPSEVHVERILGRRVRDVHGVVIGRVEEIVTEDDGEERIVTQFHVGPAALLERLARFVKQLPLLGALPLMRWEYRISWELFDLGDPHDLRVRCTRAELHRVPWEGPHGGVH